MAYQTGRRPVFSLVSDMLHKAFTRLEISDKPQLHSDQGWHYLHPAYQRLLATRNLPQSMSRKGNCLDNAVMESFFGTLKAEYFYLNRFDSLEQLQRGLDHYIRYYNHETYLTILRRRAQGNPEPSSRRYRPYPTFLILKESGFRDPSGAGTPDGAAGRRMPAAWR